MGMCLRRALARYRNLQCPQTSVNSDHSSSVTPSPPTKRSRTLSVSDSESEAEIERRDGPAVGASLGEEMRLLARRLVGWAGGSSLKESALVSGTKGSRRLTILVTARDESTVEGSGSKSKVERILSTSSISR